jgi:methyl-accepting chemotaxis protein
MKEKRKIFMMIISDLIIFHIILLIGILFLYIGGTVIIKNAIINVSILNFLLYFTVIIYPVLFISCIIKYIFLLPINKTFIPGTEKNNSNEMAINQAKNRIIKLPLLLIILNLISFFVCFVGFLFSFLYADIFSFMTLFCFIFFISNAFICTFIQYGINNHILAPIKEIYHMIYFEDKDKKEFSFKTRIYLFIVFSIIYVFSFTLFNGNLFYKNEAYYNNILREAIKNKISLEEADNQYLNFISQQKTDKNLSADFTYFQNKIVNYNAFLGLSFIIFIFICFIAGIIFNRTVFLQIKKQQSTIDSILSGKENFTKRINIYQFDEFGKLSSTINKFIDKFKEILEAVFKNTNSVQTVSGTLDKSLINASTAIEEMISSNKQITENSNMQKKIVEDIRGKVEEMLVGIGVIFEDINQLSVFVQETSSSMQETTASIQSVSSNTEKVSELSNKLVLISKEGSLSANNTIEAINEIKNASKSVMEIVDIITNISSQTNLLAMNAAIEAAHAGEKGKGFAVVADEIRNLAESSKDNASQILQHIKNMSAKVDKGVSLTLESGEAFKKIDEDINLTTHLIKEVSNSLQEQTLGTKDILSAIDSMVGSTSEIKDISDDLKKMSEDIHKYMEDLYNVSVFINNATDEQSKGSNEILSMITTVKDASVKNVSMIGHLYSVVNDFKTNKESIL